MKIMSYRNLIQMKKNRIKKFKMNKMNQILKTLKIKYPKMEKNWIQRRIQIKMNKILMINTS